MKTFKLGLLGIGGKVTIDDSFLKYSAGGPLGKKFRVALKDITAVSVQESHWGNSYVKILGNGTELASTRIPANWAFKLQDWLLENIPGLK